VNNGVCKAHVTADEAHPGCTCTEGFTGPHCEQRVRASSGTTVITEMPAPAPVPSPTPPQPLQTQGGEREGFMIAVLVISVVALLASIVISVATHIRNKDERHARELAEARASLTALTSHQEEDKGNGMNIAAGEPELFLGPPRDEDGNELHNVDII